MIKFVVKVIILSPRPRQMDNDSGDMHIISLFSSVLPENELNIHQQSLRKNEEKNAHQPLSSSVSSILVLYVSSYLMSLLSTLINSIFTHMSDMFQLLCGASLNPEFPALYLEVEWSANLQL